MVDWRRGGALQNTWIPIPSESVLEPRARTSYYVKNPHGTHGHPPTHTLTSAHAPILLSTHPTHPHPSTPILPPSLLFFTPPDARAGLKVGFVNMGRVDDNTFWTAFQEYMAQAILELGRPYRLPPSEIEVRCWAAACAFAGGPPTPSVERGGGQRGVAPALSLAPP